ncbi:MAG: beta-ketoacyl synthase N-terminal-like domain-containing protein [Abditibacteriaceae bacterium]
MPPTQNSPKSTFPTSVAVTGFCTLHDVRGEFYCYNSQQPPSLQSLFSSPQKELESTFPLESFWDRLQNEINRNNFDTLPERIGAVFSSSKGRQDLVGAEHPFTDWACDWALQKVLSCANGKGPALAPVAACAGGAHCVALGAQMIVNGQADVVLAGAIEAPLTPLAIAAYRKMNALSRSGVMRPFDVRRDGFVPRPGAACLILENAEMARQRGTKIFAYLTGWSMLFDPYSLLALSPDGESIARLIDDVIRKSTFKSDKKSTVDYVNLHATATPYGDLVEARGVALALSKSVLASATKPLTGHTLGAAGAIEALLTIRAMGENMVPPTLNLERFDTACPIDVIAGDGLQVSVDRALSLSYGFGGHMGALLFDKIA